jgi:hypothetical protein
MWSLCLWSAFAAPDLQLAVEPVEVPAAVEVPVEAFVWVNLDYPGGVTEAIAEVLGDDLAQCPNLRSPDGFRPKDADDLWRRDLLRYATVEVTAQGILVSGRLIVPLEAGKVPDRWKEGVVIRPLVEVLLRQREAQYQFRMACKDGPWAPGGPATSDIAERVLVAVAADVPFDVVNEVLQSARKARFKTFYLYARTRRPVRDTNAPPPSLAQTGLAVYVASDGGLGIDPEEEGQDVPSLLAEYVAPPAPGVAPAGRVVPYPASPFGAVVGAAGALLGQGWSPAVLIRLDAPDLRARRTPPAPRATLRVIPARRTLHAVPVTLPESGEEDPRSNARRTRFTLSGSTPHVAIFTPPAHLADLVNSPEVASQLKGVLGCYRDEEVDTPGLQGELALELRVAPSGEVTQVTLLPTTTIDDPHLRACVTDDFQALRLPSAALTPEPMLWKIQLLPRAPGSGTEPAKAPPK